jgi:hypothetical protein
MAIALVIEFPGVRREQYDNVMKELRLDETSETPQGMILHLAGPTEDGWQVVDVWETRADFDRFLDRDLGRALKNASIGTPRVREFSVYKALGLKKAVGTGTGGARS